MRDKSKLLLNTNYINEVLTNREMTYAQLAEEMGISRNTLRGYLQNPEKIPLSKINIMADALGIPFPMGMVREVYTQSTTNRSD